MTDLKKLLEPTKVMIEAGRDCQDYDPESDGVEAYYIYNAMIAESEAIPKLLAVVEAAKEACRHTGGTGKGALRKTLKDLEE